MFSKEFLDVTERIKNIEIQGAQNIAREGLVAFCDEIKNIVDDWNGDISSNSFLLKKQFVDAKNLLINTRITEPFLRNSVGFVMNKIDFSSKDNLLKSLDDSYCFVENHFLDAEKKIIEIGSNLIKNGMIVFTHCHSSTVVNILKAAKDKNISFEVHNTETRPLFQGRKTAQELLEYDIPVKHFVDSAGRVALKNCDLFLFGCDAITSQGKVINKIGSELFTEIAYKRDIPTYSCTNSWKFDTFSFFKITEIETRNSNEVWEFRHKLLNVINYAFESVDSKYVSAIVSELGILKPETFLIEFKQKYSFFFD